MICAIVAADKNWAIGRDNKLLVSIPEDMRFFKETTTGNIVIMGRKTLESFPGGRPLPNRKNIVVTKDTEYKKEGVVIVHSPEEALKTAQHYDKDIFIIGGGRIYKDMINMCDEAYVTMIDYAYEADTYFPNLDKMPEWVLVGESDEMTYFDIVYYFRRYQRRKDFKT